jgi:hypothetical protein
MRSPFYFIVKPINGKRYDNTKDIAGIEFIVSTSEEDHKFSNRFAEVIELPLGYKGPIVIGDTLLVHHNAFKFYNDMKGRQKSGKSFFKDDLFFIEPDQFFMYKHGSTWNSYDRYCFIKPIAATESYIKKPFSEEPLMGLKFGEAPDTVRERYVPGNSACCSRSRSSQAGGTVEFPNAMIA